MCITSLIYTVYTLSHFIQGLMSHKYNFNKNSVKNVWFFLEISINKI